jgi:hypothetical protein
MSSLDLSRRDLLFRGVVGAASVTASGCAGKGISIITGSEDKKRLDAIKQKITGNKELTRAELIEASENYSKMQSNEQAGLVAQIKGHYGEGKEEFALSLYVFRDHPDREGKQVRTVGRLPKAGLFLDYRQLELLNKGHKDASLGLDIPSQTFSDSDYAGLTSKLGDEFRITSKYGFPGSDSDPLTVWYQIPTSVSLTLLRTREQADNIEGLKILDPRYKGGNKFGITTEGLADGRLENLEARTSGTHSIQGYKRG